ncbi:MAG: hypothetical protein HYY18_21155 [Planctomycetes bacterium]|nr:hypothetical protein [Planctomycetota bacterium]
MERRHLACLAAAGLLLVCWIVQLVLFVGSDPDLLALSLREAAEAVEAAEPSPPLRVAVFLPSGEESGAMDREFRKRFEGKSGWKLLDRELQEEALGDYGAKINRRPRVAAEAAEAGRKLGVEAAFYAEAAAYRQNEEKAEVAFRWGLVKVPSGELVAEGSAAAAKTKGFFSLDRYRARVDGTSALFRVFLWIVMLLVLPVALVPLNELALGFRNNAASAALLSGYSVIDFVAMLLLNGFRLFTVFWGIAGILVLAGAALYTLAVLNALAED